MRARRAATTAAALLLLFANARPARAAGPASDAARPAASPDLAGRVAALDATDYATRADAADALLRDDTLDLTALAAAAGNDPPPETRERLLHVVRHHTVRRIRNAHFPPDGRGSIGIVQSVQADPLPPGTPDPRSGRTPPAPGTGPPYALVTGVLPGFPACGRLRPLDRIVALNGQALAGAAEPTMFQSMLDPFAAGDTVTLTVLRGGASRSVSLTLANRAALAGIYPPPSHTLHPRFADEWAAQRKPFDWPADGATSSPGLDAAPREPAPPPAPPPAPQG